MMMFIIHIMSSEIVEPSAHDVYYSMYMMFIIYIMYSEIVELSARL